MSKLVGWRAAAGLVAGLLLAWLVISFTLVANLAPTSPGLALSLRPGDPVALLRLAEDRLDAQGQIRDRGSLDASRQLDPVAQRRSRLQSDPEIGALARKAVHADPLHARAMRLLGEATEAGAAKAPEAWRRPEIGRPEIEGPEIEGPKTARPEIGSLERTAGFMRSAARLSAREAVAVEWMMRYSMATQNVPAAIAHADALMRSYPSVIAHFAAPFGRLLEDKVLAPHLMAVLKRNPPWREELVISMLGSLSDARMPLDLLFALKATDNPPTVKELRAYVQYLLQHKLYEMSYYTWLQFLPPEHLRRAGSLFNADFRFDPSGFPYDWAIARGSGVNVELVPDVGAGRTLRIVFGEGRAQFDGVSQVTLLSPGRYTFGNDYRGQLAGRRGLEWRVRCVETEKQIGHGAIPVGRVVNWTRTSFQFVVPTQGCRAQVAQLVIDARSTSELLIEGEIMIKGLAITRE